MSAPESATDRFRIHLSALQQPSPSDKESLDLRPATTFEAITRQMVETLVEDVREIRTRLNSLIFMVVGAMLIDVIARIMGA